MHGSTQNRSTSNFFFTRIFSFATASLIRSFWLGKTEGISNIPDSPCILISNHASYLDFLLIGYVLKRKANKNFTFWAKTKVINHFLWKTYSNIFNSIEVVGNLRKLNELSSQALNKGQYICIFPEGKRSRDGKLQPFKKGYLRLASSIGTNIVPVQLENTFLAWPAHQLLPKFKKCSITFYPPIEISKDLTEDEIDQINLTIMKAYEIFRSKSQGK